MYFLKTGCGALVSLMMFTGCGAQPHIAAASPATMPVVEDPHLSGTETIVFLRHGEKPPKGLGQLTPQGLNRSIALSKVLPDKYGKPDFIFAPDPVFTRVREGGSNFYYVRPLVTIEPTAILLGMPIQTPYGFSQIAELNAELTGAKYAHATVFVAWEHGYEYKAAVNLMKQYGGDSTKVPRWPGKDYDSLYVIRIIRENEKPTVVSFTLDHEGLDNLGTEMPAFSPSKQPSTRSFTQASTEP
jgi:hypothetical protein